MWRWVGVLAFMLPSGAVYADGTCDFDAYTWSESAAPIPIHAAPSVTSDVLGIAPVEPPGSDYADFGAEFRVLEMQGGWARVSNVTSFERSATGPDGWIDGRNIALSAQTTRAFAAPDAATEVVWSSDVVWPNADQLLDCAGEWALISFDDIDISGPDIVVKGQVTGWVRGVCPVQETTCDGVQGD